MVIADKTKQTRVKQPSILNTQISIRLNGYGIYVHH